MISVLLTATVLPQSNSAGALNDSSERLTQYCEAIDSWSENAPVEWAIFVAENSGFDLSAAVGERGAYRVNFISVEPPDRETVARGKGAMEANLVDAALSKLRIADGTIVKATGRLIISNLSELGIIDDGNVRLRRNVNRSMMDTRIVAAPATVWSTHLNDLANDVDERRGVWLEHAMMARMTRAEIASGVRLLSFLKTPRFVGASGASGIQYRSRPKAVEAIRQKLALRFDSLASRVWK